MLPKRCAETDRYYAVLGRALAYATEYELNCKNLAFYYDAKEATDYALEIFLLSKKERLAKVINKINSTYTLNLEAKEILHSARVARNWIAHEAAEYHRNMVENPAARRGFETEILLNVRDVAEGNYIVLQGLSYFTNQSIEYKENMVAFLFSVDAWIGCNDHP